MVLRSTTYHMIPWIFTPCMQATSPSPSLDEKGETRKFQKPTACKGSAPAPPANGVSTVATPCDSLTPTPKVPPVPMQGLRAPAPRTPEGEAPSKKPRVDTNQRIARLLGPSQAPSAKACPPTVSPTSVARSLAAELDDVSLSNEPVARESSLVFPKGVEHEGGECLAAFTPSAAPGSPDPRLNLNLLVMQFSSNRTFIIMGTHTWGYTIHLTIFFESI